MEDFLYAYNQPKQFGKYDLFLDGKITANEIVYKHITKQEDGSKEIENINLADKVKELESRLQTHFTFDDKYETYNNLQTAFGEGSLKETVIYIVKNETNSDNPDSRDKYNEYMIVTDKDGNKSLELIGSGSFTKQQSDLDVEVKRAMGAEKDIITKLKTITGYELDKELASYDGNIDSRIKNEIKTRDAQINGLNQEAKENRNRIEQLESEVSTEINRATEAEGKLSNDITNETTRANKAENDIITKLKTITGYEFDEDLTSYNGNIDSRIKNEVTVRKDADDALDGRISTLEKKEPVRDAQITGLNTEAKENRNRIEQLESEVSTEINRATKAENELSIRIKTIEDYNINTRVNEIETELPEEVSRAKEAEAVLQSQIATLESTVVSLQKAVVVLELPNYSINKSSTFTDTDGDNQSYIVLLDIPKGSLIKGNNTTEVKINDETIGNFTFNIDDFGKITSEKQEFSYKLSDKVTITSETDKGVLQDDGSTLITTTTTTTTIPRRLLITIGISGTHKESTFDIDISAKELEDQTHTETTTSTETIPPSTEITE